MRLACVYRMVCHGYRIGNLIEGTRQEEGRQLTKNLGVSVEITQGIGSGLCPVLLCEECD